MGKQLENNYSMIWKLNIPSLFTSTLNDNRPIVGSPTIKLTSEFKSRLNDATAKMVSAVISLWPTYAVPTITYPFLRGEEII